MKGYPFEVAIGGSQLGVVLADQIKSLDWQARKGRATTDEINDVQAKIRALIGS